MTLSNGTILTHYEITYQLGKGGMGEVYKAKDLKLGRDVAIKVLPEEFAKDADRVARFQREAKLLASLNHPNIASIYGLEESDGTHFLVLELIEGDTLADRLKRGAIPVEESLKLALQIAEALEAAHEKGVIHRDLKPANIKVTPDGKVKVLDFGLAKAFAEEQAEVNLSHSPTLSAAATLQGVILGTAAYMPPEQAKGKAVDKRTDIWAFGCVLYEMLTRKPAFQEEDVTEILASVVKANVNLDLLPPNLNMKIREVCYRCLQKDLRKRYADISDVRYEIEQVLADASGILVQPESGVTSQARLRTVFSWAAAALVLGAIIAGVAVWRFMQPEPPAVMRFEYYQPEGQNFDNVEERAFAISPDGSQFVHQTDKGLFIRSIEEWDAKFINGTEGAEKPFFSSDGKWIGFVSEGGRKLNKIQADGDFPIPVADVNSAGFLTWNKDNTIVYAEAGKGIVRISADAGSKKTLVKSKAPLYAPQILPNGKTVMYTTGSNPDFKIMLQSLESGEQNELIAEGDTAHYLQTGHIVYAKNNELWAVGFDLKKLEKTGSPRPIISGVLREGGAPQYAISDSGTLVYIPEKPLAPRTLVLVDRDGIEETLKFESDSYRVPRISPDGTKVATVILDGDKRNIWILDLLRSDRRPLTDDEIEDFNPLWTPNGQQVTFRSNFTRNGITSEIFLKAVSGTGKAESLIAFPDRTISPFSWSQDGKILVTSDYLGGLKWDIGTVSINGDSKWRPLLKDDVAEVHPEISPCGKWMTYMRYEREQWEVYVCPFPDANKRQLKISINGGNSPQWSTDGSELFYRNNDSVMAVAVRTEPTFESLNPQRLFQKTYVGFDRLNEHQTWDIHTDNRFLMMKESVPTGDKSTEAGPRKINIVLNWFEELKEQLSVP